MHEKLFEILFRMLHLQRFVELNLLLCADFMLCWLYHKHEQLTGKLLWQCNLEKIYSNIR